MSTSKKDAANAPDETGLNWQAQKSAMTRERIVDATISGFIELGYNKLTTTQVAGLAGISRGSMRHHFDSKKELIEAAIEYLHEKLLDIYLESVANIPEAVHGSGRDLIRARLDAYWNYINSDLNMVYQELSMAARTDPELKESLSKPVQDYDQAGRYAALTLFKDWEGEQDKLFFIIDITRVFMEGLVKVQFQVAADREQFVETQLQYLTLCVENIVDSDDKTEMAGLFGKTDK